MSLFQRTDLRARMVQGSLAAALTAMFTAFGAPIEDPHPFVVRIAVVACSALAGALAGVVYFYTEPMRLSGGWQKSLANVVTLLAFSAFAVALLIVAVQLPPVS